MHLSQFQTSIAVPAIAALLCSAPGVQAMPTVSSMVSSFNTPAEATEISKRFIGIGPWKIYSAVKEFLKDRNAYDYDVPNKCNVKVETTAGAECRTLVNCGPGDNNYQLMPEWNVCYLGGRQYFSRPEIGDFSITFSQAGGKNGNNEDGLNHPIFQFANINNWEPMDVQAMVDNESGDKGNLCRKMPGAAGTKRASWECGIPQIGTAAFGISAFEPVDPASGFTPGWCTMHVVQHQRNEYGVGGEYEFDVIIYDHDKKVIGLVQGAPIDPNSKTLSVTSHLPWTVEVEAKGGDNDPVVFKYGDQTWQNIDASHMSTLGNGPQNGYEEGNREGDMGFTC